MFLVGAIVGGMAFTASVKFALGRIWPAVFGKPQPPKGRHRGA
jgi:hypothetical protein